MSTQPNDGGQAFPGILGQDGHGNTTRIETPNGGDWITHNQGMSLRDWFAGQALAGTTSESEAMKFFMAKGKNEYAAAYRLLAEDSYTIADAMIEARNKPTP